MKLFGVPTCPYCKKRVNLIRTWSLKRQGEYCCPRCSGISNIYLSPLVYVFALLAVFSAGAVYFFHKFILDDISFSIVVQVMIPFVAFFLLSLFLVYLEKPVIKKVPKSQMTKKQRKEQMRQQQGMVPPVQPIDRGDYLPRGEYTAARVEPPTKIAEKPIPSPVPRAVPSGSELEKTAVVPHVRPQQPAAQPVRRTASRPAQTQLPRPVSPAADARAQSLQKPVQSVSQQPAAPSSRDDFFAKYDDPEYVQRRLRELGEKDD